jgi:hypothetical protein
MTPVEKIVAHSLDAKPVQDSASLQGLLIATLTPVLVPMAASWLGMAEADVATVFQRVVTIAGALWSVYGILRRRDIRLPGKV